MRLGALADCFRRLPAVSVVVPKICALLMERGMMGDYEHQKHIKDLVQTYVFMLDICLLYLLSY